MKDNKNLPGENPEETKAEETAKETKVTENKQKLSDLLKDETMAAEHDALVKEAVEKALAEAKEKEAEAAKLEKMTAEEKEALKKDELDKKEKALIERELKLDALTLLSEKKLPSELSSLIDYTDAQKMKASIDTLEAVFNKAVSKAVENKITGIGTLKKAPQSKTSEDVDVEAIRKAIAGNY